MQKKLVAGSELDNEIAVGVMGLRIELQDLSSPSYSRRYYRVLKDDGTPERCLYIPGGEGDLVVASYSTNITAAMQVMDKLRSSGEFCCLTIQSDFACAWDVTLTRFSADLNGLHEPCAHYCSKSLPMAICGAALEAMGIS